MIVCFMGRPGSGKSYEAVVKILDNLRLGRKVFTNIDGFDDPLYQEAQKALIAMGDLRYKLDMTFLTKEQVFHFWDFVTPGSLIVIDEIHKFFGARDWQTEKNKQFSEWASTHRHEGYDLVMLTQDLEKVDKQVRSCTEWTYEYRKVNFLGRFVKHQYLVYSFFGDEIGVKAFNSTRRSYDIKIFSCYKSYVAADVKEVGFMRHVNILKHWSFFALPVVLCLVIYMVFFKSSLGSGDPFGLEAIESRHTEIINKSRLKDKGFVKKDSTIKFDDLKIFKEYKDKPASVPTAHPVAYSRETEIISCTVVSELFVDNNHITIERCGCTQYHKVNGKTDYSKVLSKARCSGESQSPAIVPSINPLPSNNGLHITPVTTQEAHNRPSGLGAPPVLP